jgi:hypothetical protein
MKQYIVILTNSKIEKLFFITTMSAEYEKLYEDEMKKTEDNYSDCEIILVYGIKCNREEWYHKMLALWPDDGNRDYEEDFPQCVLNEFRECLTADYGIDSWTWQHTDEEEDDRCMKDFVIGHQDYATLLGLIENSDKLKECIPKIGWHLVAHLDKFDAYDHMIETIERCSKLNE